MTGEGRSEMAEGEQTRGGRGGGTRGRMRRVVEEEEERVDERDEEREEAWKLSLRGGEEKVPALAEEVHEDKEDEAEAEAELSVTESGPLGDPSGGAGEGEANGGMGIAETVEEAETATEIEDAGHEEVVKAGVREGGGDGEGEAG